MPAKIIPLADGYNVSAQLAPADVAEAARGGVKLLINNRPDDEEAGQPKGDEIQAAAKESGLAYVAIPLRLPTVTDADLDRFDDALARAEGPVLAFCRSGTRSTIIRALAKARRGADPRALIEEAGKAGYDISGLTPRLEALAKSRRIP